MSDYTVVDIELLGKLGIDVYDLASTVNDEHAIVYCLDVNFAGDR
ncbi:hypothetical protein [Halocatena marina]|uniref:Uncharacterized protein n=1 Tax=Halocatena marina TaxID=2934937 RepID=A0ABD5YXW9_9EURY|nr:hypothetical protein [Halocatena marina]